MVDVVPLLHGSVVTQALSRIVPRALFGWFLRHLALIVLIFVFNCGESCHSRGKQVAWIDGCLSSISTAPRAKGSWFTGINLILVRRGIARSSSFATLAQEVALGYDIELANSTSWRRVNKRAISLLSSFHGTGHAYSFIASIIWGSLPAASLRLLHFAAQFQLLLKDFVRRLSDFLEALLPDLRTLARRTLCVQFNGHWSGVLLLNRVLSVQGDVHHVAVMLRIVCKKGLLVKRFGGLKAVDQVSGISNIFQEWPDVQLLVELVLSLFKESCESPLVTCTAARGNPSTGKERDGRNLDWHVVIGWAARNVFLLGLRFRSRFINLRSTSRRLPSRRKRSWAFRNLRSLRLGRLSRPFGSLWSHLLNILYGWFPWVSAFELVIILIVLELNLLTAFIFLRITLFIRFFLNLFELLLLPLTFLFRGRLLLSSRFALSSTLFPVGKDIAVVLDEECVFDYVAKHKSSIDASRKDTIKDVHGDREASKLAQLVGTLDQERLLLLKEVHFLG